MEDINYYDLPEYAMKETIGKPILFAGRKKILDYYYTWGREIEEEKSKSSALIGLRKYGKTSVLQRLYNIFYTLNSNVIPFYFEIKEAKKWVIDFSMEFFSSFCSQYLGFKLRNIEYIQDKDNHDTHCTKNHVCE